MGTRQYPISTGLNLPILGYKSGMDPFEVGKAVENARKLKGLSQNELGAISGAGQSVVSRTEKGDFKRMTGHLLAIAKALDLDLDNLNLSGAPVSRNGVISKVLGKEDFRVYASAEGGDGEIILSTDAVDIIPRPSVVANIREAYGILVTGTSMYPEYRHGETAIVNPLLPFQPGEVHIFYAEQEGAARASIKELRRATADDWLVHQHNPPEGEAEDFSLDRGEWRWVHRVLGKYSRR